MIKQQGLVALLICFLVFPSLPVAADELIKNGDTIDLPRCIEISLKRHPSILAAVNTLKVGESRVGQAKANYYPQLSGSAAYSRTNPYVATTAGGSLGNSTGSVYDSYTTMLSLNQNIYDFGKTSTQVNIQNLNLDSSRSDLANITAQVIFTVKQAYYALLQAKRNQAVAQEVVGQFKQHLDIARGFFEIGVKPKFDVTKADVDLSNAKLNFLRAENALRLAKASLNNAIGMPEAPEFAIAEDLTVQKIDVPLEESLKKAYDRRPDLQAVIIRKKSYEQTIELAKKGYYPYLSGNAGYTWGGNTFPLNQGWNVGATLDIPIYSGLSTKYQIDEARANLDVLKANEESLRQTIYLEVKQALVNMQEAADRMITSALTVRQAAENVELANGRYAAGVGSPIEVTDALVTESNAKTSYISALFDYRVAQASMEKATGIVKE